MRPALLRPPVLVSGRTSDFSGVERVISTKSATDEPRRPGVVGLYLRIPMFVCPYSSSISGARTEDVDRSLAEGDDRRDQDVAGVLGVDAHLVASLSALSAFTGPATNASRAAWVKTMSSAHRTSYVLSWSATSTWTFCRL